MAEYNLAMHEVLDLHEIVCAKTLCAKKAQVMLEMAEDDQLKALIKTELSDTKKQLSELHSLLSANVQ